RSSEQSESHRFASQVEQMYASGCFRASNGKMGCISCHDPHQVPPVDQKAAFFRDRCLKCHDDQSCSLTPARRREKARDDSCIQCHMEKFENSDIGHMASTDHRILRRADRVGAAGRLSDLRPVDDTFVYFYKDSTRVNDPNVSRDLGVALM